MRTILALCVGIALFAAVLPAATTTDEESAIREVEKQIFQTMEKRDTKAHTALYADPLQTLAQPLTRAAHEKYHVDAWARQKDLQNKLIEDLGVVFLTPEVTIHSFRVEITGALDADGKPVPPRKRRVSRVFVKKDGKWLAGANYAVDE